MIIKGFVVFILFLAMHTIADAALITVNSDQANINNGDGLCSLEEALQNAQFATQTHVDCVAGDAGNNTLVFDVPGGVIFGNNTSFTITTPVIIDGLSLDGLGTCLDQEGLDRRVMFDDVVFNFEGGSGGSVVRGVSMLGSPIGSAIRIAGVNGFMAQCSHFGFDATGTTTIPVRQSLFDIQSSENIIIGADDMQPGAYGNIIAGGNASVFAEALVLADVRNILIRHNQFGFGLGVNPLLTPSAQEHIEICGPNSCDGTFPASQNVSIIENRFIQDSNANIINITDLDEGYIQFNIFEGGQSVFSGSFISQVEIEGNDFSNHERGIALINAQDITITQNTFVGGDLFNIYMTESTGLGVLNNTISGLGVGAGIFGVLSDEVLIFQNTITGHENGIYLLGNENLLQSFGPYSILENSIFDNTFLGIDLGIATSMNPIDWISGVNLNDMGDDDAGVNDLLNYPVIFSAEESLGQVEVLYFLDVPEGEYRIDFFRNASLTGSHGQGQEFLGFEIITHNGNGPQVFTFTYTGNEGDIISTTATQVSLLTPWGFGATSEFGNSVIVNGVGLDLANAPAPYITDVLEGGPYHILYLNSSTYLGACVENEYITIGICTQPGADEDGVRFAKSSFLWNSTQDIEVDVITDSEAELFIWIDFDGNGIFDHPQELVYNSHEDGYLDQGTHTLTLTIPPGSGDMTTYMRLRLVTRDIHGVSYILDPMGEALDGEVEDYQILIEGREVAPPSPGGGSSSSGSSTQPLYRCQDPQALNYSSSGLSLPALCIYEIESDDQDPIVPSIITPTVPPALTPVPPLVSPQDPQPVVTTPSIPDEITPQSGIDEQENDIQEPKDEVSPAVPTLATGGDQDRKTLYERLGDTIVVAIGVAAVAFTGLTLLPFRIQNILLAIPAYRRRRRPWGTVFDSRTGQPLDPAYVQIFDAQGQEVGDAITDMDGRFSFLVPPGTYTLTAGKTHYTFPSQKQSHPLYTHIYNGQEITLAQDEVITHNIPMDAVGQDWNEEAKKDMGVQHFFRRADTLAQKIITGLFIGGFIFSFYALFMSPTWYNVLIALLYVGTAIIMTLGTPDRAYGMVTRNGAPLSGAVVHAHQAHTDKEVMHRVIGANGYYHMLVTPGQYYIVITLENQEIYRSQPFTASSGIIKKKINL
ncbi:MAG: carboxypeptidase regulatory-like domain-containing protein [Candidatus Pacebacteria bacterium]|nr:carboxypeptidase regulatory-like domain-containing protein [Candidatus Paceibacterota bacterium]MCD8527749.1 carboxypeptidase regulatory-like domain-containing protein [Candidatus Paceibacterota bacterium]